MRSRVGSHFGGCCDAASWRNVSTVIMAARKSHGRLLNVRLTPNEASRWLRRPFLALAAGWSFPRGIRTTYRASATGAATQIGRRTHRSRRLFEEHPAL